MDFLLAASMGTGGQWHTSNMEITGSTVRGLAIRGAVTKGWSGKMAFNYTFLSDKLCSEGKATHKNIFCHLCISDLIDKAGCVKAVDTFIFSTAIDSP